jgi:hypothetical protein
VFLFGYTAVSSTNKTDRHDITEIVLRVVLSTINKKCLTGTRLFWCRNTLKISKGGNQKPYIEGQTIQWPKENGQTMIYKTLRRILKVEHHEPH